MWSISNLCFVVTDTSSIVVQAIPILSVQTEARAHLCATMMLVVRPHPFSLLTLAHHMFAFILTPALCSSGCMNGVCLAELDFWLEHLVNWTVLPRNTLFLASCSQCYPGWQGDACNDAVCKPTCNLIGGFCNIPGECKCYLGYAGADCEIGIDFCSLFALITVS